MTTKREAVNHNNNNNPSISYLRSLSKDEKVSLAKKVGRNDQFIYQIIAGRIPGRNALIKLEWHCGGHVRASDWDEAVRTQLRERITGVERANAISTV
jgi:hypothetical protein